MHQVCSCSRFHLWFVIVMYCRCLACLKVAKWSAHWCTNYIYYTTLHYTALLLGTYNPGPSELCPFSPREYTALAALE